MNKSSTFASNKQNCYKMDYISCNLILEVQSSEIICYIAFINHNGY